MKFHRRFPQGLIYPNLWLKHDGHASQSYPGCFSLMSTVAHESSHQVRQLIGQEPRFFM